MLTEKVKLQRSLMEVAERELESAGASQRPHAARKVAAMLLDSPSERERAVALYREAFEALPGDAAAASALERLLTMLEDLDGLATLLEARVRRTENRGEKLRLLARLAAVHSARGDDRGVATACVGLLALSPLNRDAIARLLRAARRLADHALYRDALARRAEVASDPHQRGRALAALARYLEAAGETLLAVARADDALAADPRAGDAATLLLRHSASIPSERALPALRAVRAVLGDSPGLMRALARAAHDARDRPLEIEALETWSRLSPFDPEPSLSWLAAMRRSNDLAALRSAVEHALSPYRLCADTGWTVADAVQRVEQIGAATDAAALAIFAVDKLGGADEQLHEPRNDTATRSGDRALQVEALERAIAIRHGEERLDSLLKLAELHRRRRDRAAEARTLLRVLALAPHDGATLDRLSALYAESGQSERLLAVLALRLEGATDTGARVERLLDTGGGVRAGRGRSRARGRLRAAARRRGRPTTTSCFVASACS